MESLQNRVSVYEALELEVDEVILSISKIPDDKERNTKLLSYINDVKTHYQVKCEGCFAFPIRTTRWKCCNCLYKNVCDNCMEYVNHKISPYYESIMKNFESVGCDPIQHVFTKIIFDGFVY